MSYREDLDALAHRCEALERQANATQEELKEAREMLAQAKANRRVSVLDNIHVAAPCSADWAKMKGDERARHCAECDKNVFDLSSLTRDEAEALILSKEGKLCVRFYQRADGTILTADCPDGVKRRRRKRRVMAAAFGAFGAAAAVAGLAHRTAVTPTMGAVSVHTAPPVTAAVETPPHVVMGEVAPEELREVKGKISVAVPPPAPRPSCRLPAHKAPKTVVPQK